MLSLSNRPNATNAGPTSRPPTFAEDVFLRIRADILSARLLPDEKMQLEKLKASYGVGATPLREALSKLTSLNLVVAEGQRGFRVAPVSIAELLDITKTRAWIESVALRAAIAAGDRGWEAEILAAIHRLEGCSPKTGEPLGDDWFRENRFFHDALTSACNSAHIMAYRASLYDLSDRYRRLSAQVQTSDRNLDAEHRQIMDAVLARDADTAIACIEDHFVETIQALLNNELFSAAEVESTIASLRKDIRNGCARTLAGPGN
jgi:GntR family carbon starvation induced transcriptional regulator